MRDLVRDTYAESGRPSIDPVVFFKLQLILFFEGLRSERQLMRVVADRLSLRWYLGYDLTEPLPDHSSLSRIRERYGLDVFRNQAPRMAYDRYRAAGWDIGSGIVESACKHLIGAREKGPGMRWSEAGAQSVAAVRVLFGTITEPHWLSLIRRRPLPQGVPSVGHVGYRPSSLDSTHPPSGVGHASIGVLGAPSWTYWGAPVPSLFPPDAAARHEQVMDQEPVALTPMWPSPLRADIAAERLASTARPPAPGSPSAIPRCGPRLPTLSRPRTGRYTTLSRLSAGTGRRLRTPTRRPPPRCADHTARAPDGPPDSGQP